MRFEDLLRPTPKGLYCPPGDFYIDPVRPVERALVTHGHADHARPGNAKVLATRRTLDIMAIRYGADFAGARQVADWGERIALGDGVTVSFHPAGHVLGSAQILVEKGDTRIVASGDYKRRRDPTAEGFEPVPCDVFITEATFALPVFRHPETQEEVRKLLRSVEQFPERAHLVGAYALGKAQRVIAHLREEGYERPIYIHGALKKLCDYYESEGIDLGDLRPATIAKGPAKAARDPAKGARDPAKGARDPAKGARDKADEGEDKQAFAGAIVVGPPSAFADKWARRFPDPVSCFASGWMRVRQRARQRGVELPLVVSDHCDWDELIETILEIGPQEVWVTHGREEALVRWCGLRQIRARPLHLVGYEDEAE